MSAQLLDGKAIAARLRDQVAEQVKALPFKPALRVVRVGFDPASEAYVRLKDKYARQVGIDSQVIHLAQATTAELVALVQGLNADASVDGILVQLPLPAGVDAAKVLEAVDPDRDVDGLHPTNMGRLWMGRPGPRPCTPVGIVRLIDETGLNLVGAEAVVVGRSHLVGKPVAALLLERHASVTLCHSRTRDLPSVTRRAEVLVVAIGKAGFITPDMIRPGAVVIDVGINRVEDKLLGDVAPGAEEVAGFLTPVPGGVGPMTVAVLMANTVQVALARRGTG